jgi:hypothetical protein
MSRDLSHLRADWQAAWPGALELWSRYTRLSNPIWCDTTEAARAEGLTGSFAMIRLTDQAIVIDLAQVAGLKLDAYATEVLAHEIGHHILVPADLGDHARMLARIRHGLPALEAYAPLVANLYADLLINDRLQRSAGLRMAEVYQALRSGNDTTQLWRFYMRIYEILWSMPRGALTEPGRDITVTTPAVDDQPEAQKVVTSFEGDARLGARLVRHYARDWLRGAGKFAVLCYPYLNDDESQKASWLKAIHDLGATGHGGDQVPSGLTGFDDDEFDGIGHPADDPELTGLADALDDPNAPATRPKATQASQAGQARQPFEFGEILRAMGMPLDQHELAVRYYRERALPHLIKYPARESPAAADPLPEAVETWDIGQPLDQVDWLESAIVSPTVIPGMTTMQRVWGEQPGDAPQRDPIDLDLYVDCSGSMPNPQHSLSYLTLAGAIIALSAFRAGARVQATLWSGKQQFLITPGFVRDEKAVLRVLTGYFGGGTAFPIHILRDTTAARTRRDRPVHVLVISDDGVTTMFADDERGNSGWDVARQALAAGRAGGTLVLNYRNWAKDADLQRAQREGWAIHSIGDWSELIAFAREFIRAR